MSGGMKRRVGGCMIVGNFEALNGPITFGSVLAFFSAENLRLGWGTRKRPTTLICGENAWRTRSNNYGLE